MGLARYFWPDPTKPDGLPYISRDGMSNPDVDSDKYDYHSMVTMSGAVNSLGLAYFLTHSEKYAQKAHDLLKVWYVDAATKMNPNLNYAQSVPGVATGRKEGIIDTLQMAYMIDSLEMLRESPAFNTTEFSAVTAWFTSFLDWLRTSTFGKGEEAANNNHGSWYDVQTMRYAIFLSNNALAMQLAELAKTRRIGAQINPDGTLPQELSRTNSLFYSEYDLTALFGHLPARCRRRRRSLRLPDDRRTQRAQGARFSGSLRRPQQGLALSAARDGRPHVAHSAPSASRRRVQGACVRTDPPDVVRRSTAITHRRARLSEIGRVNPTPGPVSAAWF